MIAFVVVVAIAALALVVRVVILILRNEQPVRVSDGWRDEYERGRRDDA